MRYFFGSTYLFTGLTKPAFALLVVADGFTELFFAKIGPISVAEIELGISALPQQVVAEP